MLDQPSQPLTCNTFLRPRTVRALASALVLGLSLSPVTAFGSWLDLLGSVRDYATSTGPVAAMGSESTAPHAPILSVAQNAASVSNVFAFENPKASPGALTPLRPDSTPLIVMWH